jgi:hypothetical protein
MDNLTFTFCCFRIQFIYGQCISYVLILSNSSYICIAYFVKIPYENFIYCGQKLTEVQYNERRNANSPHKAVGNLQRSIG